MKRRFEPKDWTFLAVGIAFLAWAVNDGGWTWLLIAPMGAIAVLFAVLTSDSWVGLMTNIQAIRDGLRPPAQFLFMMFVAASAIPFAMHGAPWVIERLVETTGLSSASVVVTIIVVACVAIPRRWLTES